MSRRCPNCSERVRFRRILTLMRQWRCAHCDSMLEMRENIKGNFFICVGFFALGPAPLAYCVLAQRTAPAWLGTVLFAFGEAGLCAYPIMWILGMFVAMRLVDNVVVVGECCQECGYHLRGLPEPRCPECGTAFTPPSSSERSPPADN